LSRALPPDYDSPEARFLAEHCSADINAAALAFAGIPDDLLEPIMVRVCSLIIEQLRHDLPEASDDQAFAWGDALNRAICARLDEIEAHGRVGRA
jgi:hypothetical protein